MTIQELIDFCTSNDVPLDTHIALRAKDDYLLVTRNISLDSAYFGNCHDGSELLEKISSRDEAGEVDYDNAPNFLIFDTGRG